MPAQRDGAQADTAPQQPAVLAEYDRLEAQLRYATPERLAAAQAELVAWLESLEKSTFSANPRDVNALCALHYGAFFLVSREEQVANRSAWFALSERVVHELPESEVRQYFNTQILLAHAQDCLDHGEVPRAGEWTARALAEDPHRDLEPYILHAQAEVERRSGTKQRALQTLERADRCIEKLTLAAQDVLQLRAQAELSRAQAYLDLGLPDLAWSSLQLCQHTAKDLPNSKTFDAALLLEINLLLATDRAEGVLSRLQWTERKSGATKLFALSDALNVALGIALVDLEGSAPGSVPDATATLETSLKITGLAIEDRHSAQVALLDFEIHAAEWSSVAKDADGTKRHLAAAGAQLAAARATLAQLEQGSNQVLRSRERAELEAYAANLMRAGKFDNETGQHQLGKLKHAYGRFIDEISQNERPRGGVGFLHFSTRRFILNELILLSIAVEGKERGFESALEALIQAQELGSLSRVLEQPGCTVAEARKRMTHPNGGVLVFMPDYHRTLVLAFDGKQPDLCVQAAPRGKWRPEVDAWMRELATSPRGLDDDARARNLKALDRLGKALEQSLFPELLRARIADWNSLTIVGDDLLDGVPFEGLKLGGSETLGTRLAIDYAPSLPVAVKLGSRRDGKPRPSPEQAGLWLVAAPLLRESADSQLKALPAIPFDEKNWLALQRPYRKLEGSIFIGEQATRDGLEDPRLEFASVLQITAHGHVLPGKERPAALVLRSTAQADDDGLLDCDEVEALHAPDTVILSACEAARGEQRYGEDGLNNLGGAFMKAGASCVILSSHTVEAQAMQTLMEFFHQRLCAGDTRAESMRAARAHVAKIPRFSHPYYYSLIQVVGLGQQTR